MEEPLTFGYWLRRRRKALDFTQAHLALLVSCSLKTIQKLEAEERRPSLAMARRLADVLGLTAAEREPFLKVARTELGPHNLVSPVASGSPPPRPSPALAHHPTNLPVPSASLIGREHDIVALRSLLQRPDTRLVTLTGPGGVGKTRLALEVATDLCDTFGDGVWFIDLSALRDPALVGSAIATSLGVKEAGGHPLLETLQAVLQVRHMLLVLDNFEQVVAAAPLVADLLKAAPRLKFLVTSRVVLHLYSEQEYQVGPLAVPDHAEPPLLEGLDQYAAVTLFVHRARAVRPDFQLTHANAPAVAAICARVDGLPLAIELAAARVKLFPPQALLARLTHRLKMLIGGARDLPERQQTLRGTIDWSYNLLTADEQVLVARLGVFVGGWTLDAAEVICHRLGDHQGDVLAGLASLVDQSLVQQSEGMAGEPRFTMLETIREYAVERLAASGEADRLQQAHTGFFLALVEAAALEWGPGQAAWLRRVQAEIDNIRAVLNRSLMLSGDAEVGLHIAALLQPFWSENHVSEGRHWLDQALDRGRDAPPDVLARALREAGSLAWQQSDYSTALARYRQSVVLFRQLGDNKQVAWGLQGLAYTALMQGDLVAAHGAIEESLAIHQVTGDELGLASSYLGFGFVAIHAGEFEAARLMLAEALRRWRQVGDMQAIATALTCLGIAAVHLGDDARGSALLQESVTVFQEARSDLGMAWPLRELGTVAHAQGDLVAARRMLRESLLLFGEQGHQLDVALCLERLAGVDVGQGLAERAARVLGAAEHLRDILGAPLLPLDTPLYARTIAATRAHLDNTAFATAWAEGQAMTLEQAVAYALETSNPE